MKKKKTKRRSSKRPCKKHKKQHRIHNWPQYNQDLKQRGSITLWLDQKALKGWLNHRQSGQKGASCFYSDGAITCVLTLQSVYHLPLRATVGFLYSLLQLLKVNLPVPDYSTLSRRRKALGVMLLPGAGEPSQNLHLVVDSTGFKIYGEGEWKVRQHGWSKRRTWVKLHLGINQATGEVMAASVTNNSKSDKEMLPDLLDQVEGLGQEIEQVSGDGGYDSKDCYQAIANRKAKATIPPRRNARLHHQDASWLARNQTLERIRALQGRRRKDKDWGRKQWKQESGYHRRSLAETTMMRLKTIFGGRLSTRNQASHKVELLLRCAALNKMTSLGMPESYPIPISS